jgi:hypothetical protein
MTSLKYKGFDKTGLKTAQNSAKHNKTQVMRAVFAVLFLLGGPHIRLRDLDPLLHATPALQSQAISLEKWTKHIHKKSLKILPKCSHTPQAISRK